MNNNDNQKHLAIQWYADNDMLLSVLNVFLTPSRGWVGRDEDVQNNLARHGWYVLDKNADTLRDITLRDIKGHWSGHEYNPND